MKWNGGGTHFIAIHYKDKKYKAYNVEDGTKTVMASDLKNLESKINGTIGMGLAVKK